MLTPISRGTTFFSSDIDKFQVIFHEAPLGIYTINRDGLIDSFNEEMVKLAGAKNATDVIGLNALTLPTYKEVGLTEHFLQGLAGTPFFIPSVKYRSFTGSKISYRLYKGVPIKNTSGEVVQLMLFVLDITEKIEIEAAQQEAKRLAIIVEQSPDAMIISKPDEARTIEYWNKGAEKLLGWKSEEVIGKSAKEILVPPSEHSKIERFVTQLNSEQFIHEETTRIHKDKHSISVDLYIFPVKNDQNTVTQLAVIMRDNSERLRFEQQMIANDEELKRMNDLMVGRELKMIELKKELDNLRKDVK